ncbi:hypothetical protein BT69DRAFT_1322015 [Atractiella rhizophila]|nr:hypothetical protein BT69DRAFT_1322015 [Atractiella rhizophila]
MKLLFARSHRRLGRRRPQPSLHGTNAGNCYWSQEQWVGISGVDDPAAWSLDAILRFPPGRMTTSSTPLLGIQADAPEKGISTMNVSPWHSNDMCQAANYQDIFDGVCRHLNPYDSFSSEHEKIHALLDATTGSISGVTDASTSDLKVFSLDQKLFSRWGRYPNGSIPVVGSILLENSGGTQSRQVLADLTNLMTRRSLNSHHGLHPITRRET